MKIYAINGSPRKNKNTAALLQKALDGVKESVKDKEIETEIINLYDFKYTGCKSCFACKRLGGKSYGKCAINDDISAILEKVSQADGIIFGSPIYLSNITGQLQSFLERLLFPYLLYDKNYSSIAPKKMPTAFIYTMNTPKEKMDKMGYLSILKRIDGLLGNIFTKPLVMYSNDTYQFDDYSKYEAECFSEKEKADHRKIQFPLDCQKAFELGEILMNNCKDLNEVRENIDEIDDQIVKLIAKRSYYVREAANFKKDSEEVKAPKRVEKIIEKVRRLADDNNLNPNIIEAVYRNMMNCFINMELEEHSKINK